MVKSDSPNSTDFFNLNSATQPTIPTINQAFLAGVYGENVALSSYANFLSQNTNTPWWPNNFLSNQTVFNSNPGIPQNSIGGLTSIASNNGTNEDSSTPLSTTTNQLQNSTNLTNATLPLAQQFGIGAYNNYLTPNFGSFLNPSNSITTSTTHSSNNIQLPTSTFSTANSSGSTMLGNIGPNLLINDTFPHSDINNGGNISAGGKARSTILQKSPRYTSRPNPTSRNCECPNCVELAQRGIPIDKKNEKHSCHIPGCLKVYGKSSHLKAHLRWHNTSRPAVYQQNRRNGELSHNTALSQSAG